MNGENGEKVERGEKDIAERRKKSEKTKKPSSKPNRGRRAENAKRDDALKPRDLHKLLLDALDKFPEKYVSEECEKQDTSTQGSSQKLEDFEKSFKTQLKDANNESRGQTNNIFHVMVREKWPTTPKQRNFLHWMLHQPEYQLLLERVGERGFTPMHDALYDSLFDFVDAVMEVEGLNIIGVLKKRCQAGNCLHLATEKSFPNLSKMIDICADDKYALMDDENSPEGTPLHIAVKEVLVLVRDLDERDGPESDDEIERPDEKEDQHSQQDHEDDYDHASESYNEEMDEDYEEPPSDVESGSSSEEHDEDGQEHDGEVYEPEPVRYRFEAREEREDRLATLLDDLDKEFVRPRPPSRARHTGTKEVKKGQLEEGATYTSSASRTILTQDLLELPASHSVRLLVEACPEALERKNKFGRTPYQEREHILLDDLLVKELVKAYAEKKGHRGDTEEAREARAKRVIFVNDPIAHYLRSYCVRNESRDRTMKRLYKPGHECHIEFDLAGFPTTVIKDEYLKQLETHLKFESILKYVALPVLSVESQPAKGHRGQPVPSNKPQSDLHRNGRSDLVAIFDWLWSRGVREIIKVMVVDDGDPPHANGAIVEALYGFRVEEWDWKRVDLCSDVISESSLAVREVSLYSSGNNAVLMGWASGEGLGNRKKFPRGLEDNERWSWNNTRCQKNIINRGGTGPNGKDIDVKVIADNNPVKFSSEFSTTEKIEEAPAWIKSVRDFSTFLMNASRTLGKGNQVPPVKIAIIDDGIDATMYDLQSKIAGGATFFPYPHSENLVNSYFVPRGKHGTLMAQLICDMCPGTQLYIARLEELPTLTGNGRRVTARSAAKKSSDLANQAVDWAVSCGVNIISMSWTIQAATLGDPEMQKLEAAINRAHVAKILMFCSASDQGANNNEPCYPGDWNQCFRIGGATFTGEKLTWVDNKVDYWFPGRNVPFPSKDGKSIVYESGSSVATAAASGLAGLLIYSARLLSSTGNTLKDKDNVFQDRTTMKTAFKVMAKGSEHIFPRTDAVLNKHFKTKIQQATNLRLSNVDIDALPWTKGSMEALENLLNYLQVR
ncbi:hypothetical protein CJF32_00001364 [Rutstroemia sp. NJR-2017a WRK4]|nr:hypothetical protein CJF32_00001364 [Rutstroemia sp. NJR-2017a WRK4]